MGQQILRSLFLRGSGGKFGSLVSQIVLLGLFRWNLQDTHVCCVQCLQSARLWDRHTRGNEYRCILLPPQGNTWWCPDLSLGSKVDVLGNNRTLNSWWWGCVLVSPFWLLCWLAFRTQSESWGERAPVFDQAALGRKGENTLQISCSVVDSTLL